MDKGVKADAVRYPAFIPGLAERWATLSDEERDRHASSVLYVKNTHSQVYPFPPYGAAVKACETERCISDFHLNAINNGFVSSAIVNFNKGVPTDSVKEQIEEDFSDKITGHQNAGRVMFSWNDTKENATELVEFKVEDFGERYKALAESVRQQIFTAFRANPNLFGIPTDGNGFANEQYAESFQLYNRTHIIPVQQTICDAYERIYGKADIIEFTPFSMGENDSTTTLAAQLGVGGTQAMMEVLQSNLLSMEQKKGLLQVLFGLDEDNIAKILGLPYVPSENIE
jgi:hypothetical protein